MLNPTLQFLSTQYFGYKVGRFLFVLIFHIVSEFLRKKLTAKMLSLEMCCAWHMLAFLVPRASPVCVHTENDAKVTSHCLLMFPPGCVGPTPYLDRSVS
jgi:hypothetical protein